MTESSPHPIAAFVCPFCGGATPDLPRCAQCSGPLDPLSRQATQNAMGPWFIRDEQHPFRPGCSYETILSMVARGKIVADTILRGPSTSQFWYPARRVPGVAHKLIAGGVCHACQQPINGESECPTCGAVFHADPDRQFLGLMPVRALPGSGIPEPTRIEPAAVEHVPPVQPAPPVPVRPAAARTAIADSRLESEIASLRVRSWVLTAVAAICGIVALGAIWVLVSGAAEKSGASSSVPVRPPAPVESKPLEPAPPKPVGRPASGPAKGEPEKPAQREPEPQADPKPDEKSPAPEMPQSTPEAQPTASPDLAALRATRWP